MRLSHVNVTMPKGSEQIARSFYGGVLGLREIPKPAPLAARGGVWFDADGLDLHISIDDERGGADTLRHFGLECVQLDQLRESLIAAGVEIHEGWPAPWKRFFVRDPFGNRIEFHEPGGIRG